jgi:hypothetical protein
MSLAPFILRAAFLGDAQISSKENFFNPKTGIFTLERLCVISPGFLNTLPLRVCSPNAAGKLDQAHFSLFLAADAFSEFSLGFRFVFAQTDIKLARHREIQKEIENPSNAMIEDTNSSTTQEILKKMDKNGIACYEKFLKIFIQRDFKQLQLLDLSWNSAYFCDEHLILLANANPSFFRRLRELDLSGNHKITPRGLQALVYNHPNRKIITKNTNKNNPDDDDNNENENEKIQNKNAEKIFFVPRKNLLPSLNSLRLARCAWIDDIALRNSISQIVTLTSLDLSGTSIGSDEFSCLNDLLFLQNLELDYCARIDDLCFKRLQDRIISSMENENAESGDSLLKIQRSNDENDDLLFARADSRSRPTFSKSLQRLSLKFAPNSVTDASLKIISQNFPHLRQLLLTNCRGMSHDGLAYFCKNESASCDMIERLDVSMVDTFSSLSRFGAFANNNNNNSSSSSSSSVSNNNYMITNEFLEEHLWKLSTQLSHLYISGYQTIRDSSFALFLSRFATGLLSSGVCPLKILDIGNCKNLKEGTLEAIGKYCPELERLVLAGNAGIEKKTSFLGYENDEEREKSFSSFRIMVSGLRCLKQLDVTETLISDYCLKCLAENCHELSVLTMSLCIKVSDGGLIFLRHLRKLKHIHAFRCPLISARGIEVFQQCLPGIVVTGGIIMKK